MASPEEMEGYYENHPDPDDSSTWGEPDSFEDAKASFEHAMGSSPTREEHHEMVDFIRIGFPEIE